MGPRGIDTTSTSDGRAWRRRIWRTFAVTANDAGEVVGRHARHSGDFGVFQQLRSSFGAFRSRSAYRWLEYKTIRELPIPSTCWLVLEFKAQRPADGGSDAPKRLRSNSQLLPSGPGIQARYAAEGSRPCDDSGGPKPKSGSRLLSSVFISEPRLATLWGRRLSKSFAGAYPPAGKPLETPINSFPPNWRLSVPLEGEDV